MKVRAEATVQRHYENSGLEARGAEEAQITCVFLSLVKYCF